MITVETIPKCVLLDTTQRGKSDGEITHSVLKSFVSWISQCIFQLLENDWIFDLSHVQVHNFRSKLHNSNRTQWGELAETFNNDIKYIPWPDSVILKV